MTQSFCLDCRFFSTDDGVRSADLAPVKHDECLQGHCRRNPPTVGHFRGENLSLEYDYGQWPIVLSTDWCGAFQPNPPPEDATQTHHIGAGSNPSPVVERGYAFATTSGVA